jgi:hypothetical protein
MDLKETYPPLQQIIIPFRYLRLSQCCSWAGMHQYVVPLKIKTLMDRTSKKVLSVCHTIKRSKHCLTRHHADKNMIFVFLDLWFTSFICGDTGSAKVMVSSTKKFFRTTALLLPLLLHIQLL